MDLRKHIKQELGARLAEHLPNALQTTWDTSAILVMVEGLTFKPASGFKGDWERKATFTGMIRAEIRNDTGESPLPEMLVMSLLCNPIFIDLMAIDAKAPTQGEPRPKARLVLRDLRDAVREAQVVTALRFDAEGEICTYAPDPGRGTGLLQGGVAPDLQEGGAT